MPNFMKFGTNKRKLMKLVKVRSLSTRLRILKLSGPTLLLPLNNPESILIIIQTTDLSPSQPA